VDARDERYWIALRRNSGLLRNFIVSFLILDISGARIEAYGSKALFNCCSRLRREAFIYKSSAGEGGGDFIVCEEFHLSFVIRQLVLGV